MSYCVWHKNHRKCSSGLYNDGCMHKRTNCICIWWHCLLLCIWSNREDDSIFHVHIVLEMSEVVSTTGWTPLSSNNYSIVLTHRISFLMEIGMQDPKFKKPQLVYKIENWKCFIYLNCVLTKKLQVGIKTSLHRQGQLAYNVLESQWKFTEQV